MGSHSWGAWWVVAIACTPPPAASPEVAAIDAGVSVTPESSTIAEVSIEGGAPSEGVGAADGGAVLTPGADSGTPSAGGAPSCLDGGVPEVTFSLSLTKNGYGVVSTALVAVSPALEKREVVERLEGPFTCTMKRDPSRPLLTWRCTFDEGITVGNLEVITKDGASFLVFRSGTGSQLVLPGATSPVAPTPVETMRRRWPCARAEFRPKDFSQH